MKLLIAALCAVPVFALPALAQTPAVAPPTNASPGPTTLPAGDPQTDKAASIPAPPAPPPGNAPGAPPAELNGAGQNGAK